MKNTYETQGREDNDPTLKLPQIHLEQLPCQQPHEWAMDIEAISAYKKESN